MATNAECAQRVAISKPLAPTSKRTFWIYMKRSRVHAFTSDNTIMRERDREREREKEKLGAATSSTWKHLLCWVGDTGLAPW